MYARNECFSTVILLINGIGNVCIVFSPPTYSGQSQYRGEGGVKMRMVACTQGDYWDGIRSKLELSLQKRTRGKPVFLKSTNIAKM